MEYGLWEIGTGTGKYSTKGINEGLLTRKCIQAIEAEFGDDAYVYKVHGNAFTPAGLPDIHVDIKGKSIWIEVKRPDGDTTKAQMLKMKALMRTGAYVGTVCTKEQAVTLVETVINNIQIWR